MPVAFPFNSFLGPRGSLRTSQGLIFSAPTRRPRFSASLPRFWISGPLLKSCRPCNSPCLSLPSSLPPATSFSFLLTSRSPFSEPLQQQAGPQPLTRNPSQSRSHLSPLRMAIAGPRPARTSSAPLSHFEHLGGGSAGSGSSFHPLLPG